jgi:hypothetical protein
MAFRQTQILEIGLFGLGVGQKFKDVGILQNTSSALNFSALSQPFLSKAFATGFSYRNVSFRFAGFVADKKPL